MGDRRLDWFRKEHPRREHRGNVAAPDFEVYYLDLENDTEPGDARDIGDRIASAYSKDCPALGHLRAYRRLVDLETDIPRYLAPPAMILTVVAVTVAVVALQNAHAVTVSFLFWQFAAPLALVIIGATFAGFAIGGVIGFTRAVRRWSHRQAGPRAESGETSRADPPRSKADPRRSLADAIYRLSAGVFLAEIDKALTGQDPKGCQAGQGRGAIGPYSGVS